MADQRGTLEILAEDVGLALLPIEDMVSVDNLPFLMIELGLDQPGAIPNDPTLQQKLADAVTQLLTLPQAIDDLVDAVQNDDDGKILSTVATILQAIGKFAADADVVAEHLKSLAGGDAEIEAFAEAFVERLLEAAILRYVETQYPFSRHLLVFFGLVEETPFPIPNDPSLDPTEPGEDPPLIRVVVRRRLFLDRLSALFNDPLSFLKTTYGWGTENFDGQLLFERIAAMFEVLGPLAGFQLGTDNPDDIANVGPAELSFYNLVLVPKTDTHPPGVAAELMADVVEATEIPIAQLADEWRLALVLTGGLQAGLTLSLLPPAALELDNLTSTLSGDCALAVIGENSDPSKPFVIFGQTGASRLQASTVRAGLIGSLKYDAVANKASADIGFDFKIVKGKAIVDTSSADGFIAKIVPEGGISLDIDFDLGWTEARGFFFTGSAGLETAIAVNQTLGPFTLATIHLVLTVAADKLRIEASLDGSGQLGPITASVERIGVALDLAFKRGNLGPVDLGVAFKPPTGLGIQIDAGPVTGGGFIEFDPDNGRYAGMLALSVYGISITAIGLLDTRLPGGQSGFSFLIIVSVEFTPIQLGFGFTLNGVGGLAGINRTMVTAAIQAGIKTHSIDHILFPSDPVKNAPQIISDLRTIFPPADGRYVFGPMAILGWGTPTLIDAELGIILEVPSPIVIAILGQLNMLLPDKDAPVVELHLDVLGIIDFGKKLFSIDATLHDSRIVAFTIFGDMAMRLSWGDNPSFLFSIGGWNPNFQPPEGFPALQRLTLALGAGDDVRLTLQTYLAVTSNTFQIGAHLELYAGSGSFNVYGWLGFDALIIFSPFSFIVDFTAGLALRSGTSTIAGISVVGKLSGPTPWHVEGEAHFSVLFFDISIHVSVTWGDSQSNPLPSTNAWTPLAAALVAQGSWSGALTPGTPQVVGLSAPEGTAAPVLIEPSGVLTLRQKVLPLDQKLTKFGEAIPDQQDEFDLTGVTLGGSPTPFTTITDLFARGQFAQLSDADKLSLPSFEPMIAGCTVGDQQIAAGTAYAVDIEFETFIVDSITAPARSAPRYPLKRAPLLAMSQSGAAARSTLRTAGLDAFAPDPRAPTLVGLDVEQYVIAGVDDLQLRNDISAPTTKGGAFAALSSHLANHPEDGGRLQVVPLYELAEVA